MAKTKNVYPFETTDADIILIQADSALMGPTLQVSPGISDTPYAAAAGSGLVAHIDGLDYVDKATGAVGSAYLVDKNVAMTAGVKPLESLSRLKITIVRQPPMQTSGRENPVKKNAVKKAAAKKPAKKGARKTPPGKKK